MKLRTLVPAGAVAAALMALGPVSASANIMWCVGDPPIQVVTPAGTRIMVNTYVYASAPSLRLAGQTTVQAVAQPDGSGGTLITVYVQAPQGQYVTVLTTVHRGHGDITQGASGVGDFTMVLDVPYA